jgi:hypothetical protein
MQQWQWPGTDGYQHFIAKYACLLGLKSCQSWSAQVTGLAAWEMNCALFEFRFISIWCWSINVRKECCGCYSCQLHLQLHEMCSQYSDCCLCFLQLTLWTKELVVHCVKLPSYCNSSIVYNAMHILMKRHIAFTWKVIKSRKWYQYMSGSMVTLQLSNMCHIQADFTNWHICTITCKKQCTTMHILVSLVQNNKGTISEVHLAGRRKCHKKISVIIKDPEVHSSIPQD